MNSELNRSSNDTFPLTDLTAFCSFFIPGPYFILIDILSPPLYIQYIGKEKQRKEKEMNIKNLKAAITVTVNEEKLKKLNQVPADNNEVKQVLDSIMKIDVHVKGIDEEKTSRSACLSR